MSYATARQRGTNSDINKLYLEDRPVHEWYRFVLSFPPHLVGSYFSKWGLGESDRVLDPFCGTGTVLVEAKKRGIASVGIEANAMANFASEVKVDWSPDPDGLFAHARYIADAASVRFSESGIEDLALFEGLQKAQGQMLTLSPEREALLLTGCISPLPLHKALLLLGCLEEFRDDRFYRHERLALAKALVYSISNLQFGPEVGVGRAKFDAPVLSPWLANIQGMAADLNAFGDRATIESIVHNADSRQALSVLEPESIDAVFTSPPYPNEKDYTRTTRLESVLLGFLSSKAELQALKRRLLRSNTRTIYKGDEDWLEMLHPDVERIAAAIEARRIELGKTSGFERLYPTVTRQYFGGMSRHLAELRGVLRPGARLAYVVGDQASYLRVMIPTGQLLAEIGVALGYEVESIDLFRTRLATATRAQLREEVVVFRWPGTKPEIARRFGRLPLGARTQREVWRAKMAGNSDDQRETNRYKQIMEAIFFAHYTPDSREVTFEREELRNTASALNLDVPLNLGDIPYSFRYRQELPERVRATAPEGLSWIIRSVGRSKYQFVLRDPVDLAPASGLVHIKIPDATPGIVAMYAKGDEQGLLAKVRYNRLIDIFTGVTCYSLQNHLRTMVPNIGQVETDEVYVGVDKRGAHYVFPVQAKGHRDRIGLVQIEQDFALCEDRFPNLICRPVAAQFMADDVIALKVFEKQDDIVSISAERHYRLVPPDTLSTDEVKSFAGRPEK